MYSNTPISSSHNNLQDIIGFDNTPTPSNDPKKKPKEFSIFGPSKSDLSNPPLKQKKKLYIARRVRGSCTIGDRIDTLQRDTDHGDSESVGE